MYILSISPPVQSFLYHCGACPNPAILFRRFHNTSNEIVDWEEDGKICCDDVESDLELSHTLWIRFSVADGLNEGVEEDLYDDEEEGMHELVD